MDMTPAITLDGAWRLRRADQSRSFPARVPGCVHADLLRAGQLPPLAWRDNELAHRDLIAHDWVWERTFTAPPAALAAPRLRLRAEGLDTLATVEVNGRRVLTADNMFRTWEAEVGGLLRPGGEANRIRVRIASPLPAMAAGQRRRPLHEWNCYDPRFAGRGHVRKQACSFGWDWGPVAPTSGIWRPIAIHAERDAVLRGVRIEQRHGRGGRVGLVVHADIEALDPAVPLALEVRVRLDGRSVAAASGPPGRPLSLAIPDAQRWWPNGMGAQPLYEVDVVLLAGGAERGCWSRRIGLRTVELRRTPDRWGERFAFAVNGRPVFAKGANWIPNDVWPSEVAPATVRRLVADAAAAHMTMLRVWGGGVYEQEAFYDACDERGILVWQDCMFACGAYPADPAFVASVTAELRDQVRRLRHHACLGLWCGNNELEQGLVGDQGEGRMPWADYRRIFDEALPAVVAAEQPEAAWWPGSPHTPHGDRADFNDPRSGDAHCWDVWFGGKPFEAQRRWMHRFQSEFGFQSFPDPRTIATVTRPEERRLNSRIMDFHQRSPAEGNKQIIRYLLDWLPLPGRFADQVCASQLVQALCIQIAAEHTRRHPRRMDGCLFWQLNDRWPAATWSAIDSAGRWKALQHLARRFFAPVLVSAVEDAARSRIEVHLSNHRPEDFSGEVRWRISDAAGRTLERGRFAALVGAQDGRRIGAIDCAAWRAREGAELASGLTIEHRHAPGALRADGDTLVWLQAREGRRLVSEQLVLWARPKHVRLRPAPLTWSVRPGRRSGTFQVRIAARVPALWVRAELAGADADWSDNWFHLDGRRAKTILVAPHQPMALGRVRRAMRARSLADWE